MEDVRYCIRLENKWDGTSIYLGVKYRTIDEAEKYAEENCCDRCNRICINQIDASMVYKNKREGFVHNGGHNARV